MAHTDRFCAKDNHKLVEYLKNKGIIKSPIVLETMCLVDRKNYVNNFNLLNNAYIDAAQKISHGRNISAPHMHGRIFEILAEKLTTAKHVLCIRCSSGYVSSCMALMIGPYGTVFHLESIPDLKERVKKIIENVSPYLLWSKRIQLLDVEDESAGYPQSELRYDVIYVGAAAAEIPQALIDQLAFGGRLVMPIGPKDGHQQLIRIDKTLDGKLKKKTITPVIYGYLDSPREITKINAVEIREEKCPNVKSACNLISECLNNTVNEKIQKQSSTKILNTSPTKPVQNQINNGCMKDDVTHTITDTLETKTDETDAQPSVKEPEENLHKTTLTKKLELESKDDLENVQKIEHTQEKSTSDSSSESRIFHEIMKTQSSMNELSEEVNIIREENQLLSKQIKELNGKKQGTLSYAAKNQEATDHWYFILIGVLAIIILDSYHTLITKLLSKD